MRIVTTLILLLLFAKAGISQNKTFAIGTTTPNANAALQIDSPSGNQGVLLPRLTTAQRNAMSLTTADKGLVVFDTDLNLIHTWNGLVWGNGTIAATSQKLIIPYSDIISSAVTNSTLYDFAYNGTNSANLMRFQNFNPTNTDTTFIVKSNGLGENAHFRVDNPSSTASALYAISNSKGVTLWGENRSATTGGAGYFQIFNSTNSSNALSAVTSGTGVALRASVTNTTSTNSVLFASTEGMGRVGQFQNNNPANTSAAVRGVTNGLGSAGYFTVNNTSNPTAALWVESNTNAFPSGAIYGLMTGTGDCAGCFRINNAASIRPTIYSETNGSGLAVLGNNIGTGPGGGFYVNNPSSGATALDVSTNGTGTGGRFQINNVTSGGRAIDASTTGTGAAIFGSTSSGYAAVAGQHNGASNGFGGLFEITNAGNSYQAIKATTNGIGATGHFEIINGANSSASLYATTNGTGASLMGETSTGFASVFALSHGSSQAISAITDGTASAGYFETGNASSSASSVFATTNGTGAAGNFQITNASSPSAALQAQTNGTGAAIFGRQTSSVNAIGALFETTNTSNNYPPLQAVAAGNNSNGIYINHTGSGGNLAVFANTDVAAIRFDKTGRGFFNGGTQNSGADVAELFDVEGSKQNYEPGDVLVISELTDRTVEKSFSSNSTKVAGVYATKPGVTLTERGVEESVEDLVPMGVIGVIPTKVCDENGSIKRGDLLVTSSVAGHAMKARPSLVNGVEIYPTGAVLGKALENWDAGRGLIKVLVNVK